MLLSPAGTSDVNLSLYDAVTSGVYDHRIGMFIDPFSGEHMTLKQAVARRAINANIKEIIHPITRERMTLQQVLNNTSLVDSDQGLFHNPKNKKSYTMQEAVDMGYIVKPLSLHSAISEGALDESGVFRDRSGRKLTLLDAMEQGLLDTDFKCILDPRTNELLSLTEARARGLINAQGQFVNPSTGRPISIHAAVSIGVAKLVSEQTKLAPKCIMDTSNGEWITFVDAVKRGCFDLQTASYVDLRKNKRMSITAAVSQKCMDSQLAEQLGKLSGLRDAMGRELTVLEACQQGCIDVQTGRVYDMKSRRTLTIQQAADEGLSQI